MKELVIISGKGGTGKTSLMAAFASLAGNKVLCDAIGTPAITTRGMKEGQMDLISGWINTITENLEDETIISKVGQEVEELCSQFPLPESFIQPQ